MVLGSDKMYVVKWRKVKTTICITPYVHVLTTESFYEILYLETLAKFYLVKLHNRINHLSLYHFQGLTFNSSLLYLKPIRLCGQRVSAIHAGNQRQSVRVHRMQGYC